MSQIVTDKDNNLKIFQFLKILGLFSQIFDGLCKLEQKKGQQGKMRCSVCLEKR